MFVQKGPRHTIVSPTPDPATAPPPTQVLSTGALPPNPQRSQQAMPTPQLPPAMPLLGQTPAPTTVREPVVATSSHGPLGLQLQALSARAERDHDRERSRSRSRSRDRDDSPVRRDDRQRDYHARHHHDRYRSDRTSTHESRGRDRDRDDRYRSKPDDRSRDRDRDYARTHHHSRHEDRAPRDRDERDRSPLPSHKRKPEVAIEARSTTTDTPRPTEKRLAQRPPSGPTGPSLPSLFGAPPKANTAPLAKPLPSVPPTLTGKPSATPSFLSMPQPSLAPTSKLPQPSARPPSFRFDLDSPPPSPPPTGGLFASSHGDTSSSSLFGQSVNAADYLRELDQLGPKSAKADRPSGKARSLLTGESHVSAAKLEQYGHLIGSNPANLQCVPAALGAAVNAHSGKPYELSSLRGFDKFKTLEHTDSDITKLMANNGYKPCTLQSALGALDQGQPVVVRQDTGSGYHAFCLLERVSAHKALAFDPDNKVGGLKVITLGKDFDANFGFRKA